MGRHTTEFNMSVRPAALEAVGARPGFQRGDRRYGAMGRKEMTLEAKLTNQLLPLKEILSSIDALPWRHALFTAERHPFRMETSVAVLDHNDVDSDDPDAVPAFAREHGLSYALTIHGLRDIAGNARAQLPRGPTLDQLLAALNYYMARDAFIDFTESRGPRQRKA
jgi:hypothetical protein